MQMRLTSTRGRRAKLLSIAAAGALTASFLTVPSSNASPAASNASNVAQPGATITSSGLKHDAIKHVWLIILENKSYDATFTGLNQNSYLWKTLPAQGVLLTNYYGTGHYSQDNYISLVSGQAPQQDLQSDCSVEDFDFGSNASIITKRT